jgi:hypothetical protein
MLPILLVVSVVFAALWLVRATRGRVPSLGPIGWSLLAGAAIATGMRQYGLAALCLAGIGMLWSRPTAPAPAPTDGEVLAAARLLGVGPDASGAAIRAAWRGAMKAAHPDAGGDAARAQALTAARDTLLRTKRRS